MTLLPEELSPAKLKAYLEQYATQDEKRPHLWKVHTDLPAFKKVVDGGSAIIANLIIPKGARLRADTKTWTRRRNLRKMRANKAFVHSLVDKLCLHRVPIARSLFRESFTYMPGQVVTPWQRFSTKDIECASGIHFFLEVRRAYYY